MMVNYCHWLFLFSLFITIHSQISDDRDYPPERYQVPRVSKSSFDSQFSSGRCPPRFLQVGEQCLYFATDGKSYAWNDAERLCRWRIGRMVDQWAEASANANQPNLKPANGVRQLVLNTPEKTEILRALYQVYGEENFAIRLPEDYNTLRHCADSQDDKWPYYCNSDVSFNTTCFETKSSSPTDFCLRDVNCGTRYLRLACEFTLAGSPEITTSRFRHCPKTRRRRFLLPIWAWILIAVGGALLLTVILVTIFAVARKSKAKKGKYAPKTAYPEPRATKERTVRVPPSTKRDGAEEPMLVRPAPSARATGDADYLQPRSDDRPTATSAGASNA